MNATQRALDMLAEIVERKDGPSGWLEDAEHALAAAKEEQADPYRPRFRSAVSGLWYTDQKAAGDIDIVEVGGVKFFPPGEGEEEQALNPQQQAVAEALQDAMEVGGVPINAEFFAEFTQRLAGRRGVEEQAAKPSFDVDMAVIDIIAAWQEWVAWTGDDLPKINSIRELDKRFRKALEAYAENGGDNLRTP